MIYFSPILQIRDSRRKHGAQKCNPQQIARFRFLSFIFVFPLEPAFHGKQTDMLAVAGRCRMAEKARWPEKEVVSVIARIFQSKQSFVVFSATQRRPGKLKLDSEPP